MINLREKIICNRMFFFPVLFLYHPHKYYFSQGKFILPVFQTLGFYKQCKKMPFRRHTDQVSGFFSNIWRLYTMYIKKSSHVSDSERLSMCCTSSIIHKPAFTFHPFSGLWPFLCLL